MVFAKSASSNVHHRASGGKTDASVVLCVYQAEDKIQDIVDNLLAMEYPWNKWELIIVDDASTDRTADTIQARIRGLPQVKLLAHTKNRGLGAARNTGIAVARGEFIFFTDDDCFPPKNWIARGVARFREQPKEVGAIAGDVKIPRHSYVADCISYLGFPAGGNLGFRNMFHVDAQGFSNSFTTANAIARKSVSDELTSQTAEEADRGISGDGGKENSGARGGPFDEQLRKVQDKDLALRIQDLGYRIRYCDDLTIVHLPMPSIRGYLHKMYGKGRYGYLITAKHKEQQRAYAKLRLRALLKYWSAPKRYLPGMLPLILAGYGVATYGYAQERILGLAHRKASRSGQEQR